MFLGEYEHSMDDKGRLVLPRRFRDAISPGASDGNPTQGCVLTKGQEGCLYVFPMEQWQEEIARLRQLPRTNRQARKYTRSFFASAIDQTLDRQGRIQVPERLREYAGLGKDVVVVGALERIEIWSKEAWEAESADADEYYSGIEESFVEGGGI